MTNELKNAIEIVKSYLDMDSDVDSEYLNAQRTIIQTLETQPTSDDEIIKALKAVRTIHNGNYAPQIDEAIIRLEAQQTDESFYKAMKQIKYLRQYIGKLEAQPTKMRDATEEERKSVKNYVESISKPTGLRFDEAQLTEMRDTTEVQK